MHPHRGDVSVRQKWQLALVLGCLFTAAIVVVACSSGTVATTSGKSTVNVMLSDPATCQAPSGPYSNVYVTITDVQANTSATAGASDSGWVDLTPGLSKNPKQIDLLGQANNQCFLATLGDTQQLQAGKYQQIRLMLAANTAPPTNSACGTAANCVVLSDSSVHTLQLSSEAQTGIKIPSGQIASGGLTIADGQTKDLDIDFLTCESIVAEGNGQYRLKPVLHAGEVSATSTSINGKVLDNATGNPVTGSVTVALEQPDPTTHVDTIVQSTTAGTDGGFVFCPLPAGTYDVVVVGTRASDSAMYQPAIVTGVTVGSTTGNIKLTLPTDTANSTATLSGTVTSQSNALTSTPAAGIVADMELSTLETVNSTTYTIPLPLPNAQSSATLTLATAAPSGTNVCPTTADCAKYTLKVPSGGVTIGAWSSTGATLAATVPLATYVVDAKAGSATTPDCSPSELQSNSFALALPTPYTASVNTLAFAGCS